MAINSGDTAFMMLCTAMVCLMTPGIPAILLSTLSLHVTVTDSRLASNAVVNSLFDGGSSLECQNCFFVYPIIDSNLKNF